MSQKYGFTFEYMTHNTMPDKPEGILCHILEYHYGMVIDWQNFKFSPDLSPIWQQEISPAINGEKSLGEKDNLQIMMPLGDDFTF